MTTFSESDIREAFQTFDRDGNGFIGTAGAAVSPPCLPPRLLLRRGRAFVREARAPVAREHAGAPCLTGGGLPCARFFHVGSGASDLHNTYLAINENLTDDEVDELIRLCDHDGDGQVGRAGMVRTHCNIIALSLARSLSLFLALHRSLARSFSLAFSLPLAHARAAAEPWASHAYALVQHPFPAAVTRDAAECRRCRTKSFEKWC